MTTKKEHAKCVEQNSQLTNTAKQNVVQENVPHNYVKIKKITFDGYENVYNMEVKNHHNFSVNGGLIVHNCMDADRYFVNTVLFKPKAGVNLIRESF